MKICCVCKKAKDKSEFYGDITKKDGIGSECKECHSERCRTPEYKVAQRNRNLKYYFGLTFEGYAELLEAQDGVCKICGKPETQIRKGRVIDLAVDHNHKTGETRGLLCSKCNQAIGLMDENIEIFHSAINYLIGGME